MDSFLKAFLVVSSVLIAAKSANACSCMPSHPQEWLCDNSTFAALVKIRNVEYVYRTLRPKYMPSRAHENLKVGEGLTLNKRSVSVNDTMDADFDHDPKPEMEFVEVVVKDLDQLSREHYYASHIRYRVKVYEAYTGFKQEEVQGKKLYIYTAASDSMCGVTLKQKEMYLLTGSIYEDRLSIGLCQHYVLWNSLDSKQRKVVRRNMRATRGTCESGCKVHYCWSGCPLPDKNTCLWTPRMERLSLKLKIHPANYVCTRELGKQDGRCAWNDPLSTAKRGRRRRRHHESALLGSSEMSRNIYHLP